MKEKWEILEKWVASEFDGKLVPGSGAAKHYGGDIETKTHLIECKQTDKKSRSIKLEEWDKIKHQAFKYGKLPYMVIEIQGRRFGLEEL